MTFVVNFFGGNGSGKSTLATGCFSLLKLHGINAEYVNEYAKDRTWEGTLDITYNPIYIVAKQEQKQFRLNNKVDVMITDSPLIIAECYTEDPVAIDLSRKLFKRYDNLNFYINRVKPYNPKGRRESELEASLVAQKMLDSLRDNKQNYTEIDGNYDGLNKALFSIMDKLDKQVDIFLHMWK